MRPKRGRGAPAPPGGRPLDRRTPLILCRRATGSDRAPFGRSSSARRLVASPGLGQITGRGAGTRTSGTPVSRSETRYETPPGPCPTVLVEGGRLVLGVIQPFQDLGRPQDGEGPAPGLGPVGALLFAPLHQVIE